MQQIAAIVKEPLHTDRGCATLRNHQPRMNDLLRGRVSRFSIDALVNIATSIGRRVHERAVLASRHGLYERVRRANPERLEWLDAQWVAHRTRRAQPRTRTGSGCGMTDATTTLTLNVGTTCYLYLKVAQLNFGVADGIRTHDNRNHNPGLYQLSYSHH